MTLLVLDLSLRIAAAAAAVGLVLTALRIRSGAVRHAAWSAVLLTMLTMPVLTAVVPKVDVPVPSPLALDPGPLQEHEPSPLPAVARQPVAAAAEAPAPAPPGWRPSWPVIAASLYLLGVLFFGIRLMAGWLLVGRLRHGAARTDVPNAAPVLQSGAVAAPLTLGVMKPVVVLPTAWRLWPDAKLQAVLAHENAHIARHDALVSLLAGINAAIFWFHPVAWWLKRAIATAAEHACDEAATRTLGDARQYAQVLVEFADAVRGRGRRVAWQALGVDGSGLLGARIDRVLRGDAMARMSRTRQFATAAGCAAMLVAAIACQRKVAELQPDPELAKWHAEQARNYEWFKRVTVLPLEEVDALEARIAANPEDWDARKDLVTYYSAGTKVPWERKVPGLRRHALWLIEHHPEHDIAAPQLSPKYDPEGYAEAVRLWEQHLARPDAPPLLIARAAQFFGPYDKPRAEQVLLRGLAIDPDSKALASRMPPRRGGYQWRTQLAQLYASALAGTESYFDSTFNAERARSPFAAEVRRTLDASSDARLLAGVGSNLLRMSSRVRERDEGLEALQSLGRQYAERALQLQPDLEIARVALVRAKVADRHARLWEIHQKGGTVPDEDLLDYRRGYPSRTDPVAPRMDWSQAEKTEPWRQNTTRHAEEVLELAAKRRDDPHYSVAVMEAHQKLALVAIIEGDRDRAVEHLTRSLEVPPSEELTYAPSMTWMRPVNYLLNAGERERVADFLERMASLTTSQRERLLEDARNIRAGRMTSSYQSMFRSMFTVGGQGIKP